MKILYKIISIPFFILAILKYITYSYPDYNIFILGGGGIFDIGIVGAIGLVINWIIVVIFIGIGVSLWELGNRDKSKKDK